MRLAAVFVAITALALVFLVGISSANMGRDYLQVQEVTMVLEDCDAVFEVQFELDRLARLYVLALGSKHIEQDMTEILVGFDDVTIKKAGSNEAVLVARGAAEQSGGYCLFDPKPLGLKVPKLTVVYPEGVSRTYYDVTETPNVFCEFRKETLKVMRHIT